MYKPTQLRAKEERKSKEPNLAYQTSRMSNFRFSVRCAYRGNSQLSEAVDGFVSCIESSEDYSDPTNNPDTYSQETPRSHAEQFGKELFNQMLENPDLVDEGDGEQWAKDAMGVINELTSFKDLKDIVNGDADFSALATAQLLHEGKEFISELRLQQKEEEREQQPPDPNSPPGEGGPEVDDNGEGQGEAKPKEGNKESQKKREKERELSKDKLRSKVFKKVKEISEDFEEAMECMSTIPGMDDGDILNCEDSAKRMDIAKRLLTDKRFRHIMEMAGRMEVVSSGVPLMSKTAKEQIVGVETGNDIPFVLNSEIANLADPDTEDIFYNRFIRSELLQYEMEGEDTKGKGPLVVMLDASGSMRGERNEFTQGMAAAILSSCHKEKRTVIFADFNYTVKTVYSYNGDTGDCSLTSFGNVTNSDCMTLIEKMLARGCGGGTNFNDALDWAMANLSLDGLDKERGPDIIMLTDGDCHISIDTVKNANELKEEKGVRFWGILVDPSYRGNDTPEAFCSVFNNRVDVNTSSIEKGIADIGELIGNANNR